MKNQKAPVKQSKAMSAAIPKPKVDFPGENEKIQTAIYTIRVSAPEARMVRIAVNQGEWQDCRPAVGYWWFDWSGFNPGEHEFTACADYEGGREMVSEPAHCVVT